MCRHWSLGAKRAVSSGSDICSGQSVRILGVNTAACNIIISVGLLWWYLLKLVTIGGPEEFPNEKSGLSVDSLYWLLPAAFKYLADDLFQLFSYIGLKTELGISCESSETIQMKSQALFYRKNECKNDWIIFICCLQNQHAKGCQSMRNCLKSITLTICLTSLDVVCGNNAKQIVIQDLLLNIPDIQHKSFDAI